MTDLVLHPFSHVAVKSDALAEQWLERLHHVTGLVLISCASVFVIASMSPGLDMGAIGPVLGAIGLFVGAFGYLFGSFRSKQRKGRIDSLTEAEKEIAVLKERIQGQDQRLADLTAKLTTTEADLNAKSTLAASLQAQLVWKELPPAMTELEKRFKQRLDQLETKVDQLIGEMDSE